MVHKGSNLILEQLNVMYHIIPFNVWYMRIENFFQYREMNGNKFLRNIQDLTDHTGTYLNTRYLLHFCDCLIFY